MRTHNQHEDDPEQLIAELQHVGKPMTGAHPTAWSGQFMAIDSEPRFEGGIMGSEKPTVNPAMRKLVQMGVAALPSLLDHLGDRRETHVIRERESPFGSMSFGDEYDPRYSDPVQQPKNVNSDFRFYERSLRRYVIKVGDLCYVAIGQIVNRRLHALRYQPTASEVINSPIEAPALEAAVKADWSGLTAVEHRAQLEQDACNARPYATANALQRLLFYYPEAGEKLAITLLNRDLFDHSHTRRCANRMMESPNQDVWRQLYDDFQAMFGKKAAATIPNQLYRIYKVMERDKDLQERARRLLAALFPNYDAHRNELHAVQDLVDGSEVVRALRPFPSSAIDAAVHSLFERTLGRQPVVDEDQEVRLDSIYHRDEIAVEAAERLRGKGHDDLYLEYFQERLVAIESEYAENIHLLRTWRSEFKKIIVLLSSPGA